MFKIRAEGTNHIYLDSSTSDFSNIVAGHLIRAIGNGLKVAYVDVTGSAIKFTNFLENVCLSKNFVRGFDRLHIEIFKFVKNKPMILKSILPLVEFYNIDENMLFDSLEGFDLVLFDNVYLDNLSKYKILNLIKNKHISTELVFNFLNKKDFDEIKDNFGCSVIIDGLESKALNGVKINKIISISGLQRLTSLYSYGYLIRSYIEKEDVKLISFDKADNIYGEVTFFQSLKKWAFLNTLYGKFDFVMTGCKRFEGNKFRQGVQEKDIIEAKNALMLLETSLKKQTPVFAENVGDIISKGMIKENDFLDLIKSIKKDALFSGTKFSKQFLRSTNYELNCILLKDYVEVMGVKKGIDF